MDSRTQSTPHTPQVSEQETTKPRPFSQSFWDASLKSNRAVYFKILIGGSFLITLTIFAIFSIYWGALWKSPARKLQGWIVDFDGSLVGNNIVGALTSRNAPVTKVEWNVKSAADYPGGPSELATAVREHKIWFALSVNPTATAALLAALTTPNASYDPTSLLTTYAVEARNENAFRAIIRPSVQGYLDIATRSFALGLAQGMAQPGGLVLNGSNFETNITRLLQVSPQTIVNPVGYTINNLIPFDVPLASAVTFVGLIYLLILSFFFVMIGNAARLGSGFETSLTLPSSIQMKLISAFVGYFGLSFFYSLLSLAFQLPFQRKFGHSGFLVFWMLNWVGMLSVGLAIEAMAIILTVQFVPFFLIIWIITNVSVCFLPIDVLPGIYKYGYGAPFYNVSLAVRTIVFGTKNQVGETFGILLAWVVVSCLTIPLFQWIIRRKAERGLQAAASPETGGSSVVEKSRSQGAGDGDTESSDGSEMVANEKRQAQAAGR